MSCASHDNHVMQLLTHCNVIVCFLQEVYDVEYVSRVYRQPTVDVSEVLYGGTQEGEVQVKYSTNKEFEKTAKLLKIMSDIRVRSLDHVLCVYTFHNR